MLNIFHALILGIIQGLTEFLPVSSSAHLIILPQLMGWHDLGLSFDVAVHLGSLSAIISYFMLDQKLNQDFTNVKLFKFLGLIAIATIPVGIAGLYCNKFIAYHARSIALIGVTTISFGILLGWAYYVYIKNKTYKNNLLGLQQFSLKYAVIIGLAQSLAIIPGVSRSGITLTACLLLGFNLLSATRISFIMAIPVILAAGLKEGIELINFNFSLDAAVILTGFLSAMLSSLLFVFYFFKYIAKIGLWPFIGYRILVGCVLISCL